MNMNCNEIETEIKKRLSPRRYQHSLNVKKIAVELAKIYGLNLEKVEKAALLHDVAKDIELLKSMEIALHYEVIISAEEEKSPALIHSKLGAAITEKEFSIKDQEILSAIEHHTAGKPGMTQIALVVYVADYLDPDKNLEDGKLILEIAKRNIYKAALLVCVEKLKYSLQSLKHIHVRGLEFYNWLLEIKT